MLSKRLGENAPLSLKLMSTNLKSILKTPKHVEDGTPLEIKEIKGNLGVVLEPVPEVPSEKSSISQQFPEIYKACSYSISIKYSTSNANHIDDLIDWSKRKVGLYTEETIAKHIKSAQVAIEKILNSKLFKHVPQDEKARFWGLIEAAINPADVDV